MCEAVNREYARRHKYMFKSYVLPYDEILTDIAPKKHCTWWKIKLALALLNDEKLMSDENIQYIMWIDAGQ